MLRTRFLRNFIEFTLYALMMSINVFSSNSAAANIEIGLNADMTSSSALAGKAIQRGAQIAIDEINEEGGILGQKLKLVVRNHRGNPARGKDNILELSERENLVAILGGLHTPVVLAELALVHEKQVNYLIPWAAGTQIIDNNYSPNYVFRVSVRDEFASSFLLAEAGKLGYSAPCLLLENTGWGRSNKVGFYAAASELNVLLSETQWFNWGHKDFEEILIRFANQKCDVIMFVGSAREGKQVINSLVRLPKADQLPIISHWGITGANFVEFTGPAAMQVDLVFLQTYSFLTPTNVTAADNFINRYFAKHTEANKVTDIFAPVGSAHAYDLVHMLARAIDLASSNNRAKVRDALENLRQFDGLVRAYSPPFTPTRHDALDASDFRLA